MTLLGAAVSGKTIVSQSQPLPEGKRSRSPAPPLALGREGGDLLSVGHAEFRPIAEKTETIKGNQVAGETILVTGPAACSGSPVTYQW